MIQTETLIINDKTFIRTYSDIGYMIHGGSPESDYAEAIDPAEIGRTYTETDMPIDRDTDAEEIISILLGGDAE